MAMALAGGGATAARQRVGRCQRVAARGSADPAVRGAAQGGDERPAGAAAQLGAIRRRAIPLRRRRRAILTIIGASSLVFQVSEALEATIGYSNELAEHLGLEPLDRKLSELMLDWTTHKDIHRIATRIDAALLGSFVKSVMRIVSYVDLVREVLLGLGMYETHNKLDSHMDRLFGGVVTNESLYLRMD